MQFPTVLLGQRLVKSQAMPRPFAPIDAAICVLKLLWEGGASGAKRKVRADAHCTAAFQIQHHPQLLRCVIHCKPLSRTIMLAHP